MESNTRLVRNEVSRSSALARTLRGPVVPFPVIKLADPQQNLPLANTQVGNLFRDRYAANLFWYVPVFNLASDPDPTFRFAAAQDGIDSAGNPFNRASLVLSLQKSVPHDVQLAQSQNPRATFREVLLEQFTVILSTTFKDASGVDQQNTYVGTTLIQPDGSIQISFDNILGVGVIIAYENIAHNHGGQLLLSASYDVWQLIPTRQRSPIIWARRQTPLPAPIIKPVPVSILTRLATPAKLPTRLDVGAMYIQPLVSKDLTLHSGALELQQQSTAQVLPASIALDVADDSGRYIQGNAHLNTVISLDQRYNAAAYAQKFTIADGFGTHPIISVSDLKNYNVRQSEFTEFKALGNISAKYPSFSHLYIGALSRTIIAVPTRYGIVRGSTGCAAVCQALLDSSSAQPTDCRFQFVFLLGPVISDIDLFQLSQDLNAIPELKEYQLQLPSQIDSHVDSALVTAFKSACIYTDGSAPQTFTLAVEIRGDQLESSAVANANLFIKQLSTNIQPYLVGSFGIKLDDYYPTPIVADVVLNFNLTSGTDELGFHIDESQQSIILVNSSPLDLQLSRYAYSTSGNVSIASLQQSLTTQQTTNLPLPLDRKELNVLVERTLMLEQPLTKQHLDRYLAFQTQDVQEVQYELGINASNVAFNARGISLIKVQVSFADLPSIHVPTFTLIADHMVGSTKIIIPVEYTISSLNASIEFTVEFINAQQSPLDFSRTNDFIDHSIFVLQNTDF